MSGDFSSGGDRLSVAALAPHSEFAAVRTDFMVERWDAEQTRWTHQKLKMVYGERFPEPVKQHFVNLHVKPYAITVERNCNLIVIAGWGALLGGVGGTSITNKFSATQGRIGVGTSSTAAASSQTSLQGDTGGSSTTSYYQLCGAAPTITTTATPCTMVFTATFGTGVANFAWAEFGTDNWSASGVTAQSLGANEVFFNRGVSSQGTKASGQTWTATETMSFGYPSGSGTVS